MIRKENNRGFSLVELLAAIVIMGILTGVAIVSVSYLLSKAEKEYYKAQEDEIIMAAKSYTQDNRNFLPKRVGQKKQVYLKTLQSKKYIGDVVDRNKKKCDPDQSYVQVYRYSKNNYSYVANLVCTRYTSEGNNPSNLEGPKITFDFRNADSNADYSKTNVVVTIEDDDKISNYRYIISKNGSEVKNSGDIDGKLEKKIVIDPGIPLKDYLPGTIEVKVIATDFYGNETTKKEQRTIRNGNAPTCTPLKINQEWTNQPPVEVQVKCIDSTGTGCQKDIYTQLFYDDAKVSLIKIADNSGNEGDCYADTYIDVTPPSTPVIKNPYENTWTNKSFSLEIASTDDTSGIAYFEYRYPNSTGKDSAGNLESEWHKYEDSAKEPGDKTPFVTTPFSKERAEEVEIRACDRAGNCSASSKSMIKIDKTAPTCTVTRSVATPNGLNDWYTVNVGLTLSTTDPIGTSDRAVKSPMKYTIKDSAAAPSKFADYDNASTGVQSDIKKVTWYGYVMDEAGNKTVCNSGEFKVDTTKPVNTVSNPYEDTWTNNSFKVKITSVEVTSGVDYYEYRYPNSTGTEIEWHKYADSSKNPGDTSPFETTAFSKERAEYVEFRSCDRAGNCSDVSQSMIKIDKTAPTCAVTRSVAAPNGLNDWYTVNVSLSISTTDPAGEGDRFVNSPVSYGLNSSNSATYDNISSKTQTDTKGVTWYGFVKDAAGNTGTCNSGSFKVDTTKPINTINNKYENKWINKDYKIKITFNEPTSGIDYVEYRYPNSTSTENVWQKYANSSKNPGDTTAFETTTFSKERAEYVQFRSCDKAGNCSDISQSMVKIDKTAPTCTVSKNLSTPNGNNGWYNSSVTLSINTTNVNGSGDRAVASPLSYGLNGSNSPVYNNVASRVQGDTKGVTWYGFVKDAAGNLSVCNTDSFKVDTTKPSCSVSLSGTEGVDSWYRSSVSLSLSTSDAYSGVDSYDLSSSSSASYNGRTSGTASSETSKTSWYGYVKDRAGNVNNCSSKSFGIDKTPPSVSTDSVSESTTWCTSSRKSISISCSDSGSGIRSNGNIIQDMGSTRYGSDTLASARNGAATTYTCIDKAGNQSSKTKHFKVVVKKATKWTKTIYGCNATSVNCSKSATLPSCSSCKTSKSCCNKLSGCSMSGGSNSHCTGSNKTYRCDSGWSKIGSGSSTKCTKKVTGSTCPSGSSRTSYASASSTSTSYSNQTSCSPAGVKECTVYRVGKSATECTETGWNCS